MHIRCKFDGGKVINRSQSGSWQHRCMGAGLEQNHGPTWGTKAWNAMTDNSPNPIFSEVAQSTAKKNENQQKRKQLKIQKGNDEKANTLVLTTHWQLRRLTVATKVMSFLKMLLMMMYLKSTPQVPKEV